MVKSRLSSHCKIVRDKVKTVIDNIFGRSLSIYTVTRTVDNWGQINALTTATTTFNGDLQFGRDLDQKFIDTGVVEVGEGVLYVHPTALSTLPNPQDQIIDGNSVWEIVEQIESPELGGDVTFYSFRVKRRVNVSDT